MARFSYKPNLPKQNDISNFRAEDYLLIGNN